MNAEAVRTYLTDLQNHIVARLTGLDGLDFHRDSWQRDAGGGGTSCVIENGHLFERGGVNFSHVMGERLPPSASAGRVSGRPAAPPCTPMNVSPG